MPLIRAEGKTYRFPDEATDDEISEALDLYSRGIVYQSPSLPPIPAEELQPEIPPPVKTPTQEPAITVGDLPGSSLGGSPSSPLPSERNIRREGGVNEDPTEEVVKIADKLRKTPIAKKIALGAGSGVASMVTGAGGAAEWMGLKQVGQAINSYGNEMQKYYDVPDKDFIYQVASGFGSMATFLVPGFGVQSGAARMALVAPRMARWLGVGASAVMEAMTEAGGVWNRSKEKGWTDEQASTAAHKAFWIGVPLVAISNRFGVFGDKGGKLRQIISSSLLEGGQEGSQQLLSNWATKDPLFQGVLESIGVGAITGGGVKAAGAGLSAIQDRYLTHKPAISPTDAPVVEQLRLKHGDDLPFWVPEAGTQSGADNAWVVTTRMAEITGLTQSNILEATLSAQKQADLAVQSGASPEQAQAAARAEFERFIPLTVAAKLGVPPEQVFDVLAADPQIQALLPQPAPIEVGAELTPDEIAATVPPAAPQVTPVAPEQPLAPTATPEPEKQPIPAAVPPTKIEKRRSAAKQSSLKKRGIDAFMRRNKVNPDTAGSSDIIQYDEPGYIDRSNKRSMGDATLNAIEEGYLPEGSTQDDLYELLDIEKKTGRPQIPLDEQGDLIEQEPVHMMPIERIKKEIGDLKSKGGKLLKAEQERLFELLDAQEILGQPMELGEKRIAYHAATLAPKFYSGLQKLITDKMPARAPVSQIKNIIQGAKKEEVEWSGIEEWLADKTVVDRSQVLDFLKSNEVRIEEVEKKDVKDETFNLDSEARFLAEQRGNVWDELPPSIQQEFRDMAMRGQESSGRMGFLETTKFSQYQTPGGENYRELLLRLPVESHVRSDNLSKFVKSMEAKYGEGAFYADYNKDDRREYDRLRNELQESAGDSATFRGGHFDEPNVLAHVRINDRVDAEGKKVLFIEEIQSDWHQKGRKEGYAKEKYTDDEILKIANNYGWTLKQEGNKYWIGDKDSPKYDSFKTREDAIRIGLFREIKSKIEKPTPNAPFKKTWHELALKRMLRYAAENGYDKLAWTTGEMQAERYDLSKQIDLIKYGIDGTGKYYFTAIKDDKDVLSKQDLEPNQIADFLGKDIAEKIINDKEIGKATKPGTLYPDDLKVGGEGMKGFYDLIIPQFLSKYVKKWGGRVGETSIDIGGKAKSEGFYDWADRNGFTREELRDEGTFDRVQKLYGKRVPNLIEMSTVPSLDITPSMKTEVLERGQALFDKPQFGQPLGQTQGNLFTGKQEPAGKGKPAGGEERGLFSAQAKPEFPVSIKTKMFAVVGNKKVEIDSYKDASLKQSEFFKGAMDAGLPSIPDIAIVDQNGKQIAYVSMNGKVWEGKPEGWRSGAIPIYDPYAVEELEQAEIFEPKPISESVITTEIKEKGFIAVPGTTYTGPQDAAAIVEYIKNPEEAKEHFWVLLVGENNKTVGLSLLSIGTVDSVFVDERDVFSIAQRSGAKKIILFHNHPTHNVEPSKEDLEITARLKAAGKDIGIEVGEHIITEGNTFGVIGKDGRISKKNYEPQAETHKLKLLRLAVGEKAAGKYAGRTIGSDMDVITMSKEILDGNQQTVFSTVLDSRNMIKSVSPIATSDSQDIRTVAAGIAKEYYNVRGAGIIVSSNMPYSELFAEGLEKFLAQRYRIPLVDVIFKADNPMGYMSWKSTKPREFYEKPEMPPSSLGEKSLEQREKETQRRIDALQKKEAARTPEGKAETRLKGLIRSTQAKRMALGITGKEWEALKLKATKIQNVTDMKAEQLQRVASILKDISRGAFTAQEYISPAYTFKTPKEGPPPPILSHVEKFFGAKTPFVQAQIPLGVERRGKITKFAETFLAQSRGRIVLKSGEVGKEIINEVRQQRELTTQMTGKWNLELKQAEGTEKWTKDEIFNLKESFEGRATPVNDKVKKMFEAWDKQRKLIQKLRDLQLDQDPLQEKFELGTRKPWGLDNYYPHFIPISEDLKVGGKARAEIVADMVKRGDVKSASEAEILIDEWVAYLEKNQVPVAIFLYMIKTNQAVNIADASAKLSAMRHRNTKFRFDSFLHREVDLPFYDPNPLRVLPNYNRQALQMLYNVQRFGEAGENLLSLLEMVRLSGGNAETAGSIINSIVRVNPREDADDLFQALRNLQVVSKMSFSAPANYFQGALGVSLVMSPKVALLTKMAIMGDFAGAQEWGIRVGQIPEMAMLFTEDLGSLSAKALKLYGFSKTEVKNYIFTSMAGKVGALHYFAKLKANPNDSFAKRKLEMLGINPEEAIKQESLSEVDLVKAADRAWRESQGIPDIVNQPQKWLGFSTDSAAGKTLFQFKSVAYNQARIVWEHAIKEAFIRKNPLNLIILLILFPAIGEIIQDIKSLGQIRHRPRGIIYRYLDNLSGAFSFGILSDVFYMAKFGSFSYGALMSTFADFIGAAGEITTLKKGWSATKRTVRHVPIVGPAAYSKLRNKREGEAKDADRYERMFPTRREGENIWTGEAPKQEKEPTTVSGWKAKYKRQAKLNAAK